MYDEEVLGPSFAPTSSREESLDMEVVLVFTGGVVVSTHLIHKKERENTLIP